MPVSGLVITVESRDESGERALRQIAADPAFTIGQREQARVAVVLDTPGRDADRSRWEWVRDLPGVTHVDVVFVHFEESYGEPTEAV